MTSTTDSNARGLEFPCDYPIKAMGKAGPALRDAVTAIVSAHVAGVAPDQVRTRPSSAGRFESVTVTVRVDSRRQLESIYQALSASDHVLWTL